MTIGVSSHSGQCMGQGANLVVLQQSLIHGAGVTIDTAGAEWGLPPAHPGLLSAGPPGPSRVPHTPALPGLPAARAGLLPQAPDGSSRHFSALGKRGHGPDPHAPACFPQENHAFGRPLMGGVRTAGAALARAGVAGFTVVLWNLLWPARLLLGAVTRPQAPDHTLRLHPGCTGAASRCDRIQGLPTAVPAPSSPGEPAAGPAPASPRPTLSPSRSLCAAAPPPPQTRPHPHLGLRSPVSWTLRVRTWRVWAQWS